MNNTTDEPERIRLTLEEVSALIEPGPNAVVSDDGDGIFDVAWERLDDAAEGVRIIEARPDRIGVLMAYKPQRDGERIAVRFFVRPAAVTSDR